MEFDVEGARKAGYSDAEIAAHLGPQSKFDVAGARSAGYSDREIVSHLTGGGARNFTGTGTEADPFVTGESVTVTPQTATPTVLERVARTAGLGARAVVKGAAGIPTLMAEGAAYPLRALTGGRYFPSPSATLDQKLTDAGLPEPGNVPERLASDVVGGLSGQGAFMKLGQILGNAASPVLRNIAEVMSANPTGQAVSAATGAGAAGLTREAGGGPVPQFIANIAGSVAPSMVSRGAAPNYRQLIEASEKHDVPLSYSDLTGKGRKLDTALEQVPIVGTGRFREAGAEKATAAARNVADQAQDSMRATPWENVRILKLAAANGDKSAKAVLAQVNNSGDDWSRIVQASGNLKLWNARNEASKLYDNVEQLAAGRGDVPLTNTLQALEAAIAKESASKLPDTAMLSTLKQIRQGLAGKTQTTQSTILGPNGQPAATNTSTVTDNGFSAMRALRSDLGDIIDGYYKGANAAVAAKGVGSLQSVKSALDRDMETFATSRGGDLAQAWHRADAFYKNAIVPYKDRALAQALKSDTPDEIYSKFVKAASGGGGEDRAMKFYSALDDKGRAAVRYGMIANALDDAAIPGKDQIAPGRFATSLERIEKASGVFFTGTEKAELNGFTNLMRHAERFGQFTENPPTGNRVVGLLLGGGAAAGAYTHPVATAGAVISAGIASRLMTTEGGRALLLEASRARVGSPEMARVMQQLPRLAAETSSAKAGDRNAAPPVRPASVVPQARPSPTNALLRPGAAQESRNALIE